MDPFRLMGLKVVGDANDRGIDDIEASFLFDLPNGSGLEGLSWLKVASWY